MQSRSGAAICLANDLPYVLVHSVSNGFGTASDKGDHGRPGKLFRHLVSKAAEDRRVQPREVVAEASQM